MSESDESRDVLTPLSRFQRSDYQRSSTYDDDEKDAQDDVKSPLGDLQPEAPEVPSDAPAGSIFTRREPSSAAPALQLNDIIPNNVLVTVAVVEYFILFEITKVVFRGDNHYTSLF